MIDANSPRFLGNATFSLSPPVFAMASQSIYTQAPPSYQGESAVGKKTGGQGDVHEPLLGQDNGIWTQPGQGGEDDDLPDDFKFGTTAAQSTVEIRMGFLRKVYAILACQILGSVVVGAAMMKATGVQNWLLQNSWSMILLLVGSIVSLVGLHVVRHRVPWNFVALAIFTTFESVTLGLVSSTVQSAAVLQALVITTLIFVGLTLYTLQSKRDFSGLGPWLMGGLMTLIGVGFVAIFVPYSNTMELVTAGVGSLIFSGFIVYDTQIILKRYSTDEYIAASVSLYLDVVNLFLEILRLISASQRD